MKSGHVLFVHPSLAFSSATERLLRAALRLRDRGYRVSISARAGSRSGEFEAADLELIPSEIPRRPFAVARTRARIRRAAPNLVHLTSAALAPLGLWLGRPYVLEVESPVRTRLPFHKSHLRAVVFPCPTLVGDAVNRGCLPRALARVVPAGPEPPPKLARASRVRGSEALRVGCAGVLDAQAGIETFIEAARLLLAQGRRLHFLLLGEGPVEQDARRRVRKLGLAEHVTITAPAAPTTAELLGELDVFVSCRLNGTPGWLVHEALALGLPCALSATTGAFSLIEDGVNGLLVERGDAGKLADTIDKLTLRPADARAMGARARRKWIEDGGPSPFHESLNELYLEALASSEDLERGLAERG